LDRGSTGHLPGKAFCRDIRVRMSRHATRGALRAVCHCEEIVCSGHCGPEKRHHIGADPDRACLCGASCGGLAPAHDECAIKR